MKSPDPEASARFENLLRPHLDRLYRFAFRLTAQQSDAEDLFQDVLTKTYASMDSLVDVDEPGPWLCRIMYNHFIDNRRRFARVRLVTVAADAGDTGGVDSFAGDLDPVRDAERRDNIMQIDKALATLSDEHRLVVLLHDVEGYKLTEIQDITGVAIGTLKSRLHRARSRLRDFMAPDGTESTARTCKGTTGRET